MEIKVTKTLRHISIPGFTCGVDQEIHNAGTNLVKLNVTRAYNAWRNFMLVVFMYEGWRICECLVYSTVRLWHEMFCFWRDISYMLPATTLNVAAHRPLTYLLSKLHMNNVCAIWHFTLHYFYCCNLMCT